MTISAEIVVFSFNRGELLLNCLASIHRFMPGIPVAVFDDRSTEKKTCEILEHVARMDQARVLQRPSSTKPVIDQDMAAYGRTYRHLWILTLSAPALFFFKMTLRL
jgi:hypothetical protein